MAGDGLIEATEANFDSVVLGSELPVLVDFWAEWCAPCRMVAPVIEELAHEREGELKVVKLNVDDNNKIAVKYGIMSIPTVILFREGEAEKKIVGALPKEALVKELGL